MANAIDSKTKRDKLTPRREPYWAPLQKGAAVGFLRPKPPQTTKALRKPYKTLAPSSAME